MAKRQGLSTQQATNEDDGKDPRSHGSLDADIIIANAPDPVFVSDLEGKILQANDAVSQLLGFRQDEVLEQSLSRFITPDETREFTAALREVVERGVMRNVVLNCPYRKCHPARTPVKSATSKKKEMQAGPSKAIQNIMLHCYIASNTCHRINSPETGIAGRCE